MADNSDRVGNALNVVVDELVRVSRTAIDIIFIPSKLLTRERLSPFTLGGIVLVLLVPIALGFPPLREWIVADRFGWHCMSFAAKEHGKAYCDFAILFCQVLIAFLIGGIVITEGLVERAKNWSEHLEQHYTKLTAEQEVAMRATLTRCAEQAFNALRPSENFRELRRKLPALFQASFEIGQTLGMDIPYFHARLLTIRFVSSFPKGLYGLFALIGFEALLFAQAVKTYFDYTIACP